MLGLFLGLIGIVLSVAVGGPILRLLYNEDYVSQTELLVWIAVDAAVGYAYIFLGTACSAMRKFRIQLPIHLVSLAVLIALCWFLIGDHGAIGAAWALLASGLVEGGAYALVIARDLRKATMREKFDPKARVNAISN